MIMEAEKTGEWLKSGTELHRREGTPRGELVGRQS